MKFIVYWEWDEKDTAALVQKKQEIDELREQYPDRFPRSLGSSYVNKPQSPPSGFSLYEGTQIQINNWKKFYEPELQILELRQIFHDSEYIKEYLRNPEASHEEIIENLVNKREG